QRSADPDLNYTALFPIYGHFKYRFLRDDIRFLLFPLYAKTRKRDVVTANYLYPFFHLRHGDGLSGWQFWPVVGHERKSPGSRTNVADEVEVVPGHDKWFTLWPFIFNEHTGLGTTNPASLHTVLPLYSQFRSANRDATSVLWPFFTFVNEREKKY